MKCPQCGHPTKNNIYDKCRWVTIDMKSLPELTLKEVDIPFADQGFDTIECGCPVRFRKK